MNEQISFASSNTGDDSEHVPSFIHSYSLVNAGPSTLPQAEFKASHSNTLSHLKSQQHVAYFTKSLIWTQFFVLSIFFVKHCIMRF